MDEDDMRAELDEIDRIVKYAVWAGYLAPEALIDEVVQSTLGAIPDKDEAEMHAIVRAMMEPELRRYEREARKWPRITDCDRLDAALDAAEQRGIVCGRNVGWTTDEAGDDTVQLVLAARDSGREVRGYAYFKGQDTEDAVDGRLLRLAFGRIEGQVDLIPDAAIGHELRALLASRGLDVEWSEDARERLGVKMVWQRRRSATQRTPWWRRLFGAGSPQ